MTRAAHVTHARGAVRRARRGSELRPGSTVLTFLVSRENSGRFHWAIVTVAGETLVQSVSFASYAEAEQAARVVHGGASQASFEAGSSNKSPADLPARRDAARGRDALDAERWLDEGGSLSRQAVAR
jgi:uncharacterized protein YegP (UPF0339 family)